MISHRRIWDPGKMSDLRPQIPTRLVVSRETPTFSATWRHDIIQVDFEQPICRPQHHRQWKIHNPGGTRDCCRPREALGSEDATSNSRNSKSTVFWDENAETRTLDEMVKDSKKTWLLFLYKSDYSHRSACAKTPISPVSSATSPPWTTSTLKAQAQSAPLNTSQYEVLSS